MSLLNGWDQNLMVSFFKKEGTYDAAVTVNATNYCGVKGHADYDPDWADEVATDKEEVTGREHGTDLDIINQGFRVTVAQPRAYPNFLIGAVGGLLGDISSTQDTGYTAYCHTIRPLAAGSTIPSFNLIGKKSTVQYLHKGCKIDSVTLAGEQGKAVSCSIDIIGSGSRATNADAFLTPPDESWVMMKNGWIWMEQDATISISTAGTQSNEYISSGTPDDLKVRIVKWSWKGMNNLIGHFGAGNGNAGVFQDLDHGRRTHELALTLNYADATDLNYYLNTTVLALQIEVKGALIQAGGTMYYGFRLRFPRVMLKKAALPKGGVNDKLTVEYDCDVQDDGTNAVVLFEGYNAQAAYFAA